MFIKHAVKWRIQTQTIAKVRYHHVIRLWISWGSSSREALHTSHWWEAPSALTDIIGSWTYSALFSSTGPQIKRAKGCFNTPLTLASPSAPVHVRYVNCGFSPILRGTPASTQWDRQTFSLLLHNTHLAEHCRLQAACSTKANPGFRTRAWSKVDINGSLSTNFDGLWTKPSMRWALVFFSVFLLENHKTRSSKLRLILNPPSRSVCTYR